MCPRPNHKTSHTFIAFHQRYSCCSYILASFSDICCSQITAINSGPLQKKKIYNLRVKRQSTDVIALAPVKILKLFKSEAQVLDIHSSFIYVFVIALFLNYCTSDRSPILLCKRGLLLFAPSSFLLSHYQWVEPSVRFYFICLPQQ